MLQPKIPNNSKESGGGAYLVYQVVLPYAKNILVGSLSRWKGGKEELWMKRKNLLFIFRRSYLSA